MLQTLEQAQEALQQKELEHSQILEVGASSQVFSLLDFSHLFSSVLKQIECGRLNRRKLKCGVSMRWLLLLRSRAALR